MTDRKQAARHATPVVRYTTAPEAFDGFGSRTLIPDAGRDDRGFVIRLVEIRPEHLRWQEDRYNSGSHVSLSVQEVSKFRSIWQLN